jgi:uncharacterized ubiquitin-like protein YukD
MLRYHQQNYMPQSRFMSNIITVFVKTLQGSLISIKINEYDTVIELKRMLWRNRQGGVHSIQLKYKGKELEDEKTLHDYKIEDGVTIDRVTYMRDLVYEKISLD